MEGATAVHSATNTKALPRSRIAGIIPYSEGNEGRIYYLQLANGMLLSDFQSSQLKGKINSYRGSRIVNGRTSLVGKSESEYELLVQVERDELRDTSVVTLNASELMGIISGSPPSRLAGVAVEMRLLSTLRSGLHLI